METGFDIVLVQAEGAAHSARSAQNGQAGHYGLLGLRHRAELAGGRLVLASTPGSGTRVGLRLLLDR